MREDLEVVGATAPLTEVDPTAGERTRPTGRRAPVVFQIRRSTALRGALRGVGALPVLLVAAALVTRYFRSTPVPLEAFQVTAALVFTPVGVLICRHLPRNRFGWSMYAVGLLGGINVLVASLADASTFLWLAQWLPWLTYASLPVPLLVFPNGELLSKRWRWCLVTAAAGVVVPAAGLAIATSGRGGLVTGVGTVPPADVESTALAVTTTGVALSVVSLAGAVTSLVLRRRRAAEGQRSPYLWLGRAAFFMGVALALDALGVPVAPVVAALGIPAAALVAIWAHRLYDLELFLNRSLLYLLLSACVVGPYALIVTLFGDAFSGRASNLPTILATVLLAVVFDPLRRWFQRVVDRFLYGEAGDPYAAVTSLNHVLQEAHGTTQVPQQIATEVRRLLRLPYAAVELTRDDQLLTRVESGSARTPTHTLLLVHQGVCVGRLTVGQRTPTQALSRRETELLEQLARQAGVAAHGARLTIELQQSRERLRRELEEERRRFRHDLHDSIGPPLSGLIMRVGASRATTRTAPDVSSALAEVEVGLQRCFSEVRRMIVGTSRPTVLDEVGLVEAIAQQAADLSSGSSGPELTCRLSDLPTLPAAVEVAAYRIASEAMTNVVRHARATRCELSMVLLEDRLLLRVRDDGRGRSDSPGTGEGLRSMAERASELGGDFDVAFTEHGTNLEVSLPVQGARVTADA